MQQEKANLSRIRDNQRRSRARRREYLGELEAKLRQCELQGVEASLQIQLVARRVADENKKLRELLSMNGVTAERIDGYAQSFSREDDIDGSAGAKGSAVRVLEQLLSSRRCCASSARSTDAERENGPETHPSGSTGNGNLICASSERYGVEALQPVFRHSASASANSGTKNTSLESHEIPSTYSAVHINKASGTSEYGPEGSISHDQPICLSAARTGISLSPEGPISANVNSCVFAMDMISTMAGGDPSTVREELGCIAGADCEVDNDLVFSVMDRYTGINANS